MRFRWLNDYWQGVVLASVAIVVSLWLGVTGQLSIYIHPRYIIFTMAMSVLAIVVLVIALVRSSRPIQLTAKRPLVVITGSLLCLLICVALVATKPKPLTSATVSQRGINTAALDLSTSTKIPSSNADYTRFTVKDWASLLGQTEDPSFFAKKEVRVTGFVTAAQDNPDVFYVSRFVVTCCAVDARPVGVPVFMPGWKTVHPIDSWVEVTGYFDKTPKAGSPAITVKPANITKVGQPNDPYLY